MYVGTYTGKGSDGIYSYRFDSNTGDLKPIGLAAKVANPSFLAIAPNQKFLYAANELNDFQGQRSGAVTGYTIDPKTGALAEINQSPSKGGGSCFVSVDKTNSTVLVANYGSGSVASFKIDSAGKLSEPVSFIQHTGLSVNPERQKGPHAHSINISPDNRFAIVADLGLDEIKIYKLDAAAATLSPNTPPATKLTPGDGPRHFVFHPNGHFAYIINEMHSTVTALRWDAKAGTLTPIESFTTLPADFKGASTTAEVQVHPSGKWLYGSNRGHDSIAVFAIDQKTGKLKMLETVPTGGKTPRNFRLDPTGKWLLAANQDGNNINVLKIDTGTGRLTATGKGVQLVSPVCIKFVPAH